MKNSYCKLLFILILGLLGVFINSCSKNHNITIEPSNLQKLWSVDSILYYTSENSMPSKLNYTYQTIEFKADGKVYSKFQDGLSLKNDTAIYNIHDVHTITLNKIFNGQPSVNTDTMLISLLDNHKLIYRLNSETLNSAIFRVFYLNDKT